MRWEKFGELDVLTRESSDKPSESPVIIMFHGYGADATDLATLNEVLDPDHVFNWYFPDGFIGTHFGGKAWFEIDHQALEKSLLSGVPYDFSERIPPGLSMAHEMVLQCVEEIIRDHPRYFIGGFSQGAMLSVDLLLGTQLTPERLLLLSGAPIDIKRWKTLSFKNAEQKFFQSHGRTDQVIQFEMAKRLNEFLLEKSGKGPFEAFSGGHEIPLEIINRLKPMLKGNRKPYQ